MSHLPKNHPLRPLYRFLAALAGAYCIAFGLVGVVRTRGHGAFAQGSLWALGLKTNLAFSILSVVAGVVVLAVTGVGRNIDRNVNLVLGPAFIAVGIVMMMVMRTSANVLNFGMSTCIVSFLIGLVLLAGGFYGETAAPEQAEAEERNRSGGTTATAK